ncbi:MAG: permease-like cell division protein FtsX [Candidatus Paceibacterota bacterium]
MFWINTKRIVRLGFINFARNISVSVAAVLITTVALLVIASLFFTKAILTSTLAQIESAVDIRVYLSNSASEEEIAILQKRIQALPEVDKITLASSDQELSDFTARHQNDQLTLQAIQEVGTNPFGSAMSIKAKDISQYSGIASFLDAEQNQAQSSIIDRVNYARNKDAINVINKMIASSKKLGIIGIIFFSLISLLITFNTISLAIYMAREEISVMRLVGASTHYIRWPFVVSGLIYGLCAAILSLIIILPITYWIGPKIFDLGTGINIFTYYLSNILKFIGLITASGLGIGALSSYLAVRKYLRV